MFSLLRAVLPRRPTGTSSRERLECLLSDPQWESRWLETSKALSDVLSEDPSYRPAGLPEVTVRQLLGAKALLERFHLSPPLYWRPLSDVAELPQHVPHAALKEIATLASKGDLSPDDAATFQARALEPPPATPRDEFDRILGLR